ncbi:hypothetical protein K449DRAFT_431817 [Hypoxylon sp. EC38]|nr:hypothetical protein K449DRAFT_431817 [Hypoxylon sp. EC38]
MFFLSLQNALHQLRASNPSFDAKMGGDKEAKRKGKRVTLEDEDEVRGSDDVTEEDESENKDDDTDTDG